MTTDQQRILVHAPRGRDAELMQRLLLSHGFAVDVAVTAAELLANIESGAGCAVLTEEALVGDLQLKLAELLTVQPPWSDFPLLALVSADSAEASQVLALELGNVTVLERPLEPHTLLTAVRAALRARRRQYEARAAIEQRDQFLAMLGHELRNPLGVIVVAAQLARDNRDRQNLPRRLDMIERQSHLLGRLVDDLLDVARVTTGKVRLRREAVHVADLLRGCIAALHERAVSRGISLVISSVSDAVIEGDNVRIEQVFNNLLSNAIKYSPAGRAVYVSSSLEGDECVVRVRDEGIGIAPELQGRVFELFAQADGSLERAEGGMGIGLTLVDRLVRLHGGRVDLVSEGLGHGTELIVRLPIGDPPGPAGVIKRDPKEVTSQLRVVLVEDNADVREVTASLLETHGCAVELAIDGPSGLARILESAPDLALIDIGLPGLDGFSIAREVRRRAGASLLLVAVTGYGLDNDRDEGRRSGFDRYVTKPLDSKVLRNLIDDAIAARDRRTQSSAENRA